MDGILNINKPSGLTSFGVVARVKRITHEKHTGHAGTLDPLASGVLPVCLGQATRVIEYLFNETKTYRAEVRLGLTTDTYDITGTITQQTDPSAVSRGMLDSVMERFRGTIRQVPPMYSALKHHGQPLYRLARAGIEVERPSRTIHILKLDICEWHPPLFTILVECSKGTYIRSLAHDIGQALGCGAAMQSLVRERVGAFTQKNSVTLDELERSFSNNTGSAYLYSCDYALTSFPAIIINTEHQCALVHGVPLPAESTGWPTSASPVRVYNQGGDFVGMIRYIAESNQWKPDKIFLKPCCQTSTSTEDPPEKP